MVESFIIFVVIVVGGIILAAIGFVALLLVAYNMERIKTFIRFTIGISIAVGLCGGGLALLVNVGGFPGAVGIFLMIAGMGLDFILFHTLIEMYQEWRTGRLS